MLELYRNPFFLTTNYMATIGCLIEKRKLYQRKLYHGLPFLALSKKTNEAP